MISVYIIVTLPKNNASSNLTLGIICGGGVSGWMDTEIVTLFRKYNETLHYTIY